jgi:hypothetical protein
LPPSLCCCFAVSTITVVNAAIIATVIAAAITVVVTVANAVSLLSLPYLLLSLPPTMATGASSHGWVGRGL